ncbi:hypothetical protein PMSD_06810 [Paenibacillus macquariensis subsp. defensor]|nr:hypothetical protein PMSD_06810 [Paenibacillus macquariensis subsp. defensor]
MKYGSPSLYSKLMNWIPFTACININEVSRRSHDDGGVYIKCSDVLAQLEHEEMRNTERPIKEWGWREPVWCWEGTTVNSIS